MGFNRVRQLVKKIDMFSTSDLLRYKDEPEYATMTGTVLTLTIIGVIGLLVYQVVVHTVKKDDISWKQQTTKQVIPEDLTISMKDMKFGLALSGVDLSDEDISYFDVQMLAYQYWKNGTSAFQEIPLSPCKAQNWNDSSQMQSQFDEMDGQSWLCPNENASTTIGGRWSGKYEKRFDMVVAACGTLFPSKTNCANSTQMTQMWDEEGEIYASVMVVTTNIQPDQQDPIEYFIEDSNFIIFSQTVAQRVDIQISEYEIQTDHSLLPFKDIQVQEGAMLSGVSKNYNRNPDDDDFYAIFDFKKSATTFSYSRSFHKIDQTMSYAGGLIGVVVGLFFIMSPYTELCYELSLANQLFVDEEGKPVETRCNFISYMLFYAYVFLNLCCKCVKSKRFDLYEQCSDQMQKQLDISYILKRINNLQRSVIPERTYKPMTFEQADKKAQQMFPKDPSSQGSIKDEIPYHDNTSTLRHDQTPQPSQDLKSIQVLPSSRVKPKKTKRRGWDVEVTSSFGDDL